MRRRHPALLLALAFAAGILASDSCRGWAASSGLPAATVATAAAALAAPLALISRRFRAGLALAALLGWARGLGGAPPPLDSTAAFEAISVWSGRVAGARPGGFRLESVRGHPPVVAAVALPGRIDVAADGGAPPIGARVAVAGRLDVIEGRRNPGLPDPRLLARRDRVVARLRADAAPRVLAAPDLAGRCAARLARGRAAFAAREDALYAPDVAAYLRALFLGDRSLLDPALRWDFRDTGTAHLLALSGQHVVLIALLVERAVAFAGTPFGLRAPACLAALALYLALVGAPASIARAGVALAAYLLARPLRRRFDAGNGLGLALLVLLALDPEDLWDAGLTLSFGATAGLIFLLPILRDRLFPRSPRRLGFLVDPLRVTLAASWPLVPLEAALFGAVPVAGPIANLLLVPATSLLLALHVAVLALSSVPWDLLFLPSPGPDAAAAASLLARATLAAVRASARALPPPFVVPAAWAPFAALYALATVALIRPPRALRGVHALLLPIAALVAVGIPTRAPLRVTLFDVGQGDAILVEAGASRVLVDAGPRWSGWDAGARVVAPALRAAGIRRLDALVLSHGDADHCGGAAAVLDAVPARVLFEPDADAAPRTRTHAGVRDAAARGGAASRTLAAGDRLRLAPRGAPRAGERGSASIAAARVLHPPRSPAVAPAQAHGNARSIVLDVALGSVHVLLTGDLPAEEEARLVAAGGAPRGAILKVAHHGSRGSSAEAFLAAVRPPAALVSAGARNRYGHPHPEALARLEAVGARVLRTDRDGALVIEADGARAIARGTLDDAPRWALVFLAPDDPHPIGPLPRAPAAAALPACD